MIALDFSMVVKICYKIFFGLFSQMSWVLSAAVEDRNLRSEIDGAWQAWASVCTFVDCAPGILI